MTDFISGKLGEVIKLPAEKLAESDSGELFTDDSKPNIVPSSPLVFSAEAKKVSGAGEALWRYYHRQVNPNPNASFYDIKEHFQGRKENGHMKSSSDNQDYNNLHAALKLAQKVLEAKIQPKVYEYGFLK